MKAVRFMRFMISWIWDASRVRSRIWRGETKYMWVNKSKQLLWFYDEIFLYYFSGGRRKRNVVGKVVKAHTLEEYIKVSVHQQHPFLSLFHQEREFCTKKCISWLWRGGDPSQIKAVRVLLFPIAVKAQLNQRNWINSLQPRSTGSRYTATTTADVYFVFYGWRTHS